MSKRVTILDIAKKLNVSTTTVNKALSGKPKVSSRTRKLVLETAEQLGYRPNKSAQASCKKAIEYRCSCFPNPRRIHEVCYSRI